MSARTIICCAILYGIAGIIAFGHCAANVEPCKPGAVICTRSESQVFGGLAAGLFWPLYFSWELQEPSE